MLKDPTGPRFAEALAPVVALFAPLPLTWAFCGGWAVDLFLDRGTRAHKDIDIAVLRADQLHVFDYLRRHGWRLEKAVAGSLIPLAENEETTLPVHTIWCRKEQAQPDFIEILLNESQDDQFLFRRDRTLRCPLRDAFLHAPGGLPILAPQIVLLYKSAHPELVENQADFQAVLPVLDLPRRQWLAQALSRLAPGHAWLRHLPPPARSAPC
jgi:hypothetical protein